jgi:hypothetical protein
VAGCDVCAVLARRREEARERDDGSAESDADVLLRRHPHQVPGPPPPRTRRIFRYVPYVIVQDPCAAPEYEAVCVSGDEADCGAASGTRHDPADVEEWQRLHTQETRHFRYRRCFADYAVLERAEPASPSALP